MTAWCVMLMHRKGGALSCVRPSAAEAKAAAERKCARHPGSYILCTLPYLVHKITTNMYHTTVPADVRGDWEKQEDQQDDRRQQSTGDLQR